MLGALGSGALIGDCIHSFCQAGLAAASVLLYSQTTLRRPDANLHKQVRRALEERGYNNHELSNGNYRDQTQQRRQDNDADGNVLGKKRVAASCSCRSTMEH